MRLKRLKHEHRIFWVALVAGLPAAGAALAFLWIGGYSDQTKWTVMAFIVLIWLACSFSVIGKVRFPLQTISNLLAAIREGDYSIRLEAAEEKTPWAKSSLRSMPWVKICANSGWPPWKQPPC